MPTYVYRCSKCEHQFEIVQKMTDDPLTQCPECQGKIARLLFPPGIVFKGSGFHINDYPSSGSSVGSTTRSNDSSSDTKKSSEPATASKS